MGGETLGDLAREGIEALIDMDTWDKVHEHEDVMRSELQHFADEYEEREEEE